MNKRLILPLPVLLVALLVAGCTFNVVTGSGKIISESRDISGFTRITLAGIGDVIVTQGEQAALVIEAEENLIPYFETKVQGSTLTIGLYERYRTTTIQPTRPVKFHVTLPEIEAVTLAGSGNIIASDLQAADFNITLAGSGNISTGDLSAARLSIQLAGSGDISLGAVTAEAVTSTTAGSGNISFAGLETTTVDVTIAGSGDVRLSGQATRQEIKILGSGDYTADELESQEATLLVAGSGNVRVWAAQKLDVTILGSGDVLYYGNPRLGLRVSGSGAIRQADGQ